MTESRIELSTLPKVVYAVVYGGTYQSEPSMVCKHWGIHGFCLHLEYVGVTF